MPACRPPRSTTPCKIDFSKVKPRLVSEYFEFPKSTEQKLEEALAEIASLKKTKASLEKEFVEYKIKMLEAELNVHHKLVEQVGAH